MSKNVYRVLVLLSAVIESGGGRLQNETDIEMMGCAAGSRRFQHVFQFNLPTKRAFTQKQRQQYTFCKQKMDGMSRLSWSLLSSGSAEIV